MRLLLTLEVLEELVVMVVLEELVMLVGKKCKGNLLFFIIFLTLDALACQVYGVCGCI